MGLKQLFQAHASELESREQTLGSTKQKPPRTPPKMTLDSLKLWKPWSVSHSLLSPKARMSGMASQDSDSLAYQAYAVC